MPGSSRSTIMASGSTAARLVEAFDPGRGPIDVEAALDELGHDLVGGLGVVLDQAAPWSSAHVL